MQLNPARGRKPVCLSLCLAVCLSRFMQLNPARGRKPAHGVVHGPGNRKGLCSSTPRGDGNDDDLLIGAHAHRRGLCSSTPRGDGNSESREWTDGLEIGLCSSTPRGDGNYARIRITMNHDLSTRFMQLNPARGRKLLATMSVVWLAINLGLCSSTPRGDGNDFMHSVAWRGPGAEVYAAQPREGTETPRRRANNRNAPAVGLCSSTPRGDGNRRTRPRTSASTPAVYAAQPREGTETHHRLLVW